MSIGDKVLILAGISAGEAAIIRAGAVTTADIQSEATHADVRARRIGEGKN